KTQKARKSSVGKQVPCMGSGVQDLSHVTSSGVAGEPRITRIKSDKISGRDPRLKDPCHPFDPWFQNPNHADRTEGTDQPALRAGLPRRLSVSSVCSVVPPGGYGPPDRARIASKNKAGLADFPARPAISGRS